MSPTSKLLRSIRRLNRTARRAAPVEPVSLKTQRQMFGQPCLFNKPTSNGSAGLPRRDGLRFHFNGKHGTPFDKADRG
jgi:hypothetical protein